jgi:hypothetical protein
LLKRESENLVCACARCSEWFPALCCCRVLVLFVSSIPLLFFLLLGRLAVGSLPNFAWDCFLKGGVVVVWVVILLLGRPQATVFPTYMVSDCAFADEWCNPCPEKRKLTFSMTATICPSILSATAALSSNMARALIKKKFGEGSNNGSIDLLKRIDLKVQQISVSRF